MTIVEAIKSNKKYKRKGDSEWYKIDTPYVFKKPDILADDWEIDETIEISKSKLEELANMIFYYRKVDAPDYVGKALEYVRC
jgi:hypothetical protein